MKQPPFGDSNSSRSRIGWRTAAAFLAVLTLAGCTSPNTSGSSAATSSPVDCKSVLQDVIQRDRQGDTSQEMIDGKNTLRERCSVEHEVAKDYFDMVTATTTHGAQSCERWRETRLQEEAIALLEEGGLCSATPASPSSPKAPSESYWETQRSWPDGGLGWDQAKTHAGSWQRVCGPLKSIRETEYGLFVNIGRDYPSADRFTFVIWGDWWMDPISSDSTVCASGEIYIYEGVVGQMELGDPGEIEIWN